MSKNYLSLTAQTATSEIEQLAITIAASLPDGEAQAQYDPTMLGVCEQRQRWSQVRLAAGRRILLGIEDGRLRVSGQYPTDHNGHVVTLYHRGQVKPDPSITCALSRKPAAIVRDIQRRFLADYHDHYDEVQQTVAERLKLRVKQIAAFQKTAQLVGFPQEFDRLRDPLRLNRHNLQRRRSIDIEVTRSSQLRIKIATNGDEELPRELLTAISHYINNTEKL